jgi:hypothetical protein
MKRTSLAVEGLTLERLLKEAAGKDVIFLTQAGETRFALMAADEGDEEVAALRSNPEFIAYLAECKKRALKGPRHTIEEIRELYGLASSAKVTPKRPTRRTKPRS